VKVNEVVDIILENIRADFQGTGKKDTMPGWFERSKLLITTTMRWTTNTPADRATTAAIDELMGLGYNYHDSSPSTDHDGKLTTCADNLVTAIDQGGRHDQHARAGRGQSAVKGKREYKANSSRWIDTARGAGLMQNKLIEREDAKSANEEWRKSIMFLISASIVLPLRYRSMYDQQDTHRCNLTAAAANTTRARRRIGCGLARRPRRGDGRRWFQLLSRQKDLAEHRAELQIALAELNRARALLSISWLKIQKPTKPSTAPRKNYRNSSPSRQARFRSRPCSRAFRVPEAMVRPPWRYCNRDNHSSTRSTTISSLDLAVSVSLRWRSSAARLQRRANLPDVTDAKPPEDRAEPPAP
jgi:hypothetical protein